MAKEQFTIAASKEVMGLVEIAGRRAGVSRGQAFEDFLTFVRCSLAGQTMEKEYLATVEKGYAKGKKGKRGIDAVVRGFSKLVVAMDETGQDVLGDIFQGGITYGEAGQYFTPEPLTELMANLIVNDDDSDCRTVCDPACGSGRFLLAIGKEYPSWEFTGQDVDHRCVQMTAINMGLRGLFGYAVWQNTLTLDVKRVYEIGLNPTDGVIREIPVEGSPFDYCGQETKDQSPNLRADQMQPRQRDLF